MTYPERIVPDETEPGVVALHLKRYVFAEPWCRGKVVVDAACGVGYGTARLGRVAEEAIGVDVDAEAIAYARRRYGRERVRFETGDVADLPLAGGSVDVVCSFETIEHVDDAEALLREVVRVLRPDGTLLVSTPQATRTTERPENPFHRVEYARADFEALLRRHFDGVELYGQRRIETRRHRLLRRLDVLGLRRRVPALRRASALTGTAPTDALGLEDVAIERGALDGASEIVAVCTLPRRP